MSAGLKLSMVVIDIKTFICEGCKQEFQLEQMSRVFRDSELFLCPECDSVERINDIVDRLRAELASKDVKIEGWKNISIKTAKHARSLRAERDTLIVENATLIAEQRGTGKILERLGRAGSWGVMVDAAELQRLEALLAAVKGSYDPDDNSLVFNRVNSQAILMAMRALEGQELP